MLHEKAHHPRCQNAFSNRNSDSRKTGCRILVAFDTDPDGNWRGDLHLFRILVKPDYHHKVAAISVAQYRSMDK